MKSQSGELDTEGLKQDFSQIVQADQSGQLEELAPGLGEHFANAGPPQNGQDTRSAEGVPGPPSRGERRPPLPHG
jgi:hypothetical protein